MGFKKSLYAWAFYDFANTIFSALVLTSYFPLYLTEIAGANRYLGVASGGSMILAGLFVPFAGALSDRTGKTKTYLIYSTLVCILFMASLSFFKQPLTLILSFLAACVFYHASLVFYNALLPVVAPPQEQGFASGLGTGLGYLGVLCVLPIAHFVDQHWGRPFVFMAGAAFFLLASLPMIFFVLERQVEQPISFRWGLWAEEWKRITKTVQGLGKNRPLGFFLAGNFLVVDALNSTIFWVMVYAREVFAPAPSSLIGFLMLLNLAAFIAGLVLGIFTDRAGAIHVLTCAAACLAITLALCALSPGFQIFVAVTLVGGSLAIAGIWTAGRKVLIELAEPARLGEYFGVYGLTTKVSVVSSLVFSLLADHSGFRTALASLILPASAGLILLLKTRTAMRRF